MLPKNQDVLKPTLKVGDRVRLKLQKRKNRNINELWTGDIFTIYKVFKYNAEYKPPYYYVEDDDEKYTEKLYEKDLQKIGDVENKVRQPERFDVSKIMDRRTDRNGNVQYKIRWKGYKQMTWEDRKTLLKDIPKMLRIYERGL